MFFGVRPDVLSFALLFIFLISQLAFGNIKFSDLPRPEAAEPATRDTSILFNITSGIYNFTHSIFVFLIVFLLVFLILKRPLLEMAGWLFHIIIDIPTHSYRFYPTPFLWPFSQWKFDGISWAEPWFIAINYSAIAIVYLLSRRKK